MIGADAGKPGIADDAVAHQVSSLPIRGEIDVVGAGDSVSANLGAALAAGAEVAEAVTLANAAASHVIHQVGTTGVATVEDLRALVFL
jgi:bifunctional ADP-heptose synthase (sugar kinase/adenylyltransferase)